jgi:methylated-DNA-[protein]-cysteine S-methyltransferase
MSEPIFDSWLETPLGWLQISGSEAGISAVTFTEDVPEAPSAEIPECLQACYSQLQAYFRGERQDFDFPLAPNGTDFQQKVWQQLKAIPYGKTVSYLAVANQLGGPTFTRAVGLANGKNPLAIVVPCHRVIGANGSLTGYAGGLWRKKWLLEFENPPSQTSLF